MDNLKYKTVAVVGCGPRGLNALENLLLAYELSQNRFNLKIIIFERTGLYGCGQVYAPHQVLQNWMNLSERSLELSKRKSLNYKDLTIDSFPSFHEWKNCDFSNPNKADIYPPRGDVGVYLIERFNSLANPLIEANILELQHALVTSLVYEKDRFVLASDNNQIFNADEVLLTVGHQPTIIDGQISKWIKFSKQHKNTQFIEKPYPIDELVNQININSNSKVAIRGFGLAMIDVTRALAQSTESYFEIVNKETQEMIFRPGKNFPKKIIPFSLDGMPMHPKPLNKTIDDYFIPSSEDLNYLEQTISEVLSNPKDVTSTDFLKLVMSKIIAKVFIRLDTFAMSHNYGHTEIEKQVAAYINGDTMDSHLFPTSAFKIDQLLKFYIDMATGKDKISLDYCIGQVWRHCQPSIYDTLSFNSCNNEVVASIVKLDERVKRYSFGPPVDSVQQIIALVDADVLNLDYVNNPTIELSNAGWELSKNANSIMVKTMINSVLDAPKIKIIDSPILKHLLANNIIRAVHDDLGIATDEYGYLSSKENLNMPIAVLGRLAKGTIIGVDAILECYGKRPQSWASKAADYHELYVK